MRIAFLTVKNILRGGGIEKYTYELGRRLAARGHEVTVFSMGHYGQVLPQVEGMRIVRVPALRRAATEKLSACIMATLQVLLSRRYDVVHCHSVAAGALGLLPRLLGMKTVLQMHGIEWRRNRWSRLGKAMLYALEWLSLRSHNAYSAVSRTQCDYYARRGRAMGYIPTGADIHAPSQPDEILKQGLKPRQYVLFVSRLVREKGAHLLIEAFRALKTDYRLVMAGGFTGDEDYKNTLLELAGDDPRIVFAGYVEGRLLHELLSNAAVYVQPSELEGLSISLLEAMSYGNCCLVSDIDENREAIGEAGVTFDSGSVLDLRRRLGELVADPERCAAFNECATQRVRENYRWDWITDDFETLYRSLAPHVAAIAAYGPRVEPAPAAVAKES